MRLFISVFLTKVWTRFSTKLSLFFAEIPQRFDADLLADLVQPWVEVEAQHVLLLIKVFAQSYELVSTKVPHITHAGEDEVRLIARYHLMCLVLRVENDASIVLVPRIAVQASNDRDTVLIKHCKGRI